MRGSAEKAADLLAGCGLRWGNSTRTGQPHELHEPALLDESRWAEALPLLRETFPDWQLRSK